mgnify:CR=1 FL=1
MAIVTISRQVAALGDEIATALAKELGYEFVNRKIIEKRIVELGFPQEKLSKYDERKPNFFASLAKDRDEYLDYVQTAVLESAAKNNCILIGRGSFFILENVPNVLAVRFVANDEIRKARLMKEFDWNEKQALQRINESDTNRTGFNKSFFNVNISDASNYHLVLNTGVFDEKTAVPLLKTFVQIFSTPQAENEGQRMLSDMLVCQNLINKLIFEHKLAINFLNAKKVDGIIELHGVADSSALSERALHIASSILPDEQIKSCISVVQDFKAYN